MVTEVTAQRLKNIDLNLLVIFEAIYATGNMSRAAKRLGMSQPAVSNAVSRLREIVGDPLFVRSASGVEPTARTRQLIHPVRESLNIIGHHLGTLQPFDATYKRVFRITIIDPIESLIMPAVIAKLLKEAPGLSIECVQAHPDLYDDIRAGSLDMACFPYPVDITDLVVKPIARLFPVVISRRNHPEIVKPLDRETFQRLPHLALGRTLRGLTNIDKNLAVALGARSVVYMVAKVWSIPALVEQSDLLGVLPRAFAESVCEKFDLDIHELPIEIPEQHIYLAWHTNSENDPGNIWLREAMFQAAREHETAAEWAIQGT
jgi:DNA-binding transcriptional LysR family regulator